MVSTASRLKVMLAATLGSTLEWYDFFIFAASTVLVFNKVFFPASDPFVGTLLGLGTFAAGFLARPFGGIVFGVIGDRIGRKNTLIVSLLMMGVATVAIGLLPVYDTIGIAAPLLLLLIRIFQGVAVGGEATGALTIVAESAIYAALMVVPALFVLVITPESGGRIPQEEDRRHSDAGTLAQRDIQHRPQL